MSIQRWDQFPETLSLRGPLSRLLADDAALDLALDLEETPEAYIVRAALPGFRPEDVNVSLTGDTLTIQAAQEREEERKERDYLIRERRTGLVRRSIALPGRVEADKAQARYENGELVLTLPKTEESKPRQIAINGQGQGQLSGSGAYQYGYSAGQSEQYRGREFEEAEHDLRGEYEGRHRSEGGGISGLWERLREEIRAGWNRARGK